VPAWPNTRHADKVQNYSSNYDQLLLADGATSTFSPLSKYLYMIADSSLIRYVGFIFKYTSRLYNNDFLSRYRQRVVTITQNAKPIITRFKVTP